MKMLSKDMVAIIAAFFIILIAVVGASFYVWQEMGAISLGFHGWLAVILGCVGSVMLGAGLMWLSFYSSRAGYDERAEAFTSEFTGEFTGESASKSVGNFSGKDD